MQQKRKRVVWIVLVSISVWRIVCYLCLVVVLAGCGANSTIVRPPPNFTEADLVGTWESVSSIHDSEKLVIRADHTFVQRYLKTSGTVSSNIQGTWNMEYRASGCVYVHLEGMRYIYHTENTLVSGNRYPDGSLIHFREFCEQIVLTMPDKVVLSVGSQPRVPRGLVLRFPCPTADCLDEVLELVTP